MDNRRSERECADPLTALMVLYFICNLCYEWLFLIGRCQYLLSALIILIH